MKTVVPDYYAGFKCIADKCRHSCCIGWEIDIDSVSLARYKAMPGVMGEKLRANIDDSGATAHFALCAGDRCPFLLKDGLCELIVAEGEGILCSICADHPRYRNFLPDATEMGLGLCCEEAARLILSHKKKTELVTLSCDGADTPIDERTAAFYSLRAELIGILQDRDEDIFSRLTELERRVGAAERERSFNSLCRFYAGLDVMDSAWTDMLSAAKARGAADEKILRTAEVQTALEQLAVYFILRQLADALDDGLWRGRAAFACHAVRFICALYLRGEKQDLDTLCEIVRLYSAEIEYCEDNLCSVLEMLDPEE